MPGAIAGAFTGREEETHRVGKGECSAARSNHNVITNVRRWRAC